MNYREKLKRYGKKTITKNNMGELFAQTQDDDLFWVVQELEAEGILSPIRSSKTNGNQRFPIYLKYKISLPQEDYTSELSEIKRLHPALQSAGYWERKPMEYRRYRKQIQALDKYLFKPERDPAAVSRKERSFEIFSEEKQLDDRSFCRILENIGLDQNVLGFYDTPEFCFNDYIPERKDSMTLLICENKDIWFNIRRRMFEDRAAEIFGVRIDGVVYGSGNQVTQKEALTAYTGFFGGAEVHYLYWGDIDRAGLNIYLSLCRNNPELEISIFHAAYEEMLRLARNRTIPDSEDGRGMMDSYDVIFDGIAEEYREEMRESILANKRIPQEIIPYTHLLRSMR